ncbi:MAG: TIM-barrel domain-containing protein, partial [Phycisphaerae bacterium]
LEQCNRHVAVPVLLSNYGYGVFWDNPAITEVNAGTAPVQHIAPENLIDAHGRAGALTAQYFSGTSFEDLKASAPDSQLTLDWQSDVAGGIVGGTAPGTFCVRWTGAILAPQTGLYTFSATINGDLELWVDSKRIISRHDGHPNTSVNGKIELQAGRHYSIRLQYVHHAERSQMFLRWQLPTTPQQAQKLSWSSDVGDCIDYYVIRGGNADDTIAAWRNISGNVPMMGKWVWGFWQSKCFYSSQTQILGVASEYRSMHIPMDGIVQDLFYWQPAAWGSNEFNPLHYPAPADMIGELHRENVHFMISVWAQFAPGSANYRQLEKAGVLYPSHCKDRYYDAFNPVARKLYWDDLKTQLFSLGVDAWWLDASEPQLCNNWGEFADIKTHAGYGAFVYNAYPLMHTTAVYQGQRAATSHKRVMILTRSAWAGQQRNSTVIWSGDIPATWQVLREQIPAGINFALSGIPYWNTDIGGFFSGNPQDPAYCELFIRWFQFGAFCPMFRVHGTNYPKEMWRFGPPAMRILEKFDHLRYRLLPYIYSVAWMVTSRGYSMLRG